MGIPFKDLFYKKRMIIGALIIIFFWGLVGGVAAGYGEPFLTYMSVSSFTPGILFALQLVHLGFMVREGYLSAGKRLSSYVKGLSAAYVIFGALANIPWTVLHTCYYKEIYPELYPAPSIPLVSKVLLALTIISMYFWTLCYLTYLSTYSVDPELSTVLFSTKENVRIRDLGWKRTVQIAIVTAIPIIYFVAFFGTVMYVSDVLIGREFFPDPYLLLNATAILMAFLSFLTSGVLMFLAERRFAEIIVASK
ncbi:MAG: hypothetical protein ACTSXW_05170 [Candidatus Baldrarchaeia archaeon]